jgi:hypothetical protein
VQLAAGAEAAPVLDDLPVGHPPHLDVVHDHLAPGGGHPEGLAHVPQPAAAPVDDEVASATTTLSSRSRNSKPEKKRSWRAAV